MDIIEKYRARVIEKHLEMKKDLVYIQDFQKTFIPRCEQDIAVLRQLKRAEKSLIKDIEKIPTEKMLEIELQGDIDKEIASIEANAKTAQEAFKYTAEVNIAQIEAASKEIEATFDSIGDSIQSTADLMGTALGALDSDDFQTKWAALDILREEQEIRKEAFELQKKLTEAQLDYLDAKTKRLAEGESIITIDSSGLEPALEMIMWEIIEKVQIRASEEASEFLLGLGGDIT